MQHELFQSKLKNSIDVALLSEIIRSSSSGQNSHRTATMELIFEGSIRARRERALTNVENSLWLDPTPRPMRTCEAPSIPIPQVQTPVLVTALEQSLQPPPNADTNIFTSLASISAKYEALQDPPTLSKPKDIKKVTRHKEPPADAKINTPPSEDTAAGVSEV